MVNKEELLPLFNMRSFSDMWGVIDNNYTRMNFHDELMDNDRIAEYKWIAQQLRKYMSRQQKVILAHDHIEDMMKEIEELISKSEEYGDSRKTLVYNIMRDDWLVEIYRILEMNLNEEEEDDGWTD